MIVAIAAGFWALLWMLAPPGSQSALKASYPDISIVEEVRAQFLYQLSGVTPDAQALVAGLSIGVRTMLSPEMSEQMKLLSLTHLVAVSGANLAIVMGAIYFLTSAIGLRRNLRFTFSLLAMAGYVLVVGPESSVLRAATMAIFVLVGIWVGRGSKPLYSLSWAVIFLLCIDPGLAVDYGFGLSAFATAGLVLLATRWFEILRTKMPDWLALGVAASSSAQLWTTPILLMLQPSLPLYSVLANLLVEPVVAPVTVLGIFGVCLAPFFPWATSLVTWVASIGTWWITFVASIISTWPLARLHFVQGAAGVGLAAGIVAGISLFNLINNHKIRRAIGFGTLVLMIFCIAWSGFDYLRYSSYAKDWQLVNCDVGQGDGLLVRSQGRVALVDVGREPAPIRNCLENLGIEKIDLLVLTHFDADHIGGIEGVSNYFDIGIALISGFEDDRPLVSKVHNALRINGTEIQVGFRGMTGELGDFQWRILSPTFSASEAQDSNDASVIIEFLGVDFDILALGDLGEIGQSRLLREYSGAMPHGNKPLITKVAHHGSADQSREFYERFPPTIAIFSVGKNDYGHPTQKMLRIASSVGAKIVRTDKSGSVAMGFGDKGLWISSAGKL